MKDIYQVYLNKRSDNTMTNIYKVKEVADILKVTPHTVRNYISDHKLKAIYMGKGFMIREDDLDEFIKSRYLFQYDKGEN